MGNVKKFSTEVEKLRQIKEVKAVYLFGSLVKKKITPFSDIDICVITKGASESTKAEISSLSSEKLQVSVFEDLPVNIQIRVFKEGKPLIVKDSKFVASLKAKTISRFLDFKPVLVYYYKKALGLKYEI